MAGAERSRSGPRLRPSAVSRRHGPPKPPRRGFDNSPTRTWLGSDEARDALVAEARPNGNDDASRRIGPFVGLMNRTALDPPLMWVALNQLDAVRPAENQIQNQPRYDPVNTATLLRALERAALTAPDPAPYLTRVLARSPLLGSAETFRAGRRAQPIGFGSQRPGRSFIDALRHHVATHDTPFTRAPARRHRTLGSTSSRPPSAPPSPPPPCATSASPTPSSGSYLTKAKSPA